MIQKEIAERVLTVGCDWRTPRGGVAWVMRNLRDYVFPTFKCTVNSGGMSVVAKLLTAVRGLASYLLRLATDSDIRLVHIHTASYRSFTRSAVYMDIARWFGRKVILHIHGGAFREFYAGSPDKIGRQLSRADRLIVLSDGWKQFFSTIVDPAKISIVNNIITPPSRLSICCISARYACSRIPRPHL